MEAVRGAERAVLYISPQNVLFKIELLEEHRLEFGLGSKQEFFHH